MIWTDEQLQRLEDRLSRGLWANLGPDRDHCCVVASVRLARDPYAVFSDDLPDAEPYLVTLAIRVNDCKWSTRHARAEGLRDLALRLPETAGRLDVDALREAVAEAVHREAYNVSRLLVQGLPAPPAGLLQIVGELRDLRVEDGPARLAELLLPFRQWIWSLDGDQRARYAAALHAHEVCKDHRSRSAPRINGVVHAFRALGRETLADHALCNIANATCAEIDRQLGGA